MTKPVLVGSKMMCQIFNVTHTMLSEWTKRGMPHEAGKKYDVGLCLRWWTDLKREEINRRIENLGREEQETRLKRAQADYKELQLARERAELVPMDEMTEQYGRFVSACRARLLSIGGNLAPRVIPCKTPAEVKVVIDAEIWDALNELSRAPDLHAAAAGNTHSTAKTHSKRMGGQKPRTLTRKRSGAGTLAD